MGGVNYTEDMLDEIKIQHLSKAIQEWYNFFIFKYWHIIVK